MTFLWPTLLWLLLAVPLLVALYCLAAAPAQAAGAALPQPRPWCARRMGPGQRLRRHIPPVLFLLALVALLLAAARPMAVITLPSEQQTIMLAMDVSGSMRATDVEPNRLTAAQNAAKAFIAELPRHVRVGIVAFAGSAQLAQLPTQSHEDLVARRSTASSCSAARPRATASCWRWPRCSPTRASTSQRSPAPGHAAALARRAAKTGPGQALHARGPPGSYNSAAIIMLTDGQRTTGVDPLEAAKMAADRGVRVYTVGMGTVQGETIGFEGWSMRVRLDEETLKAVALRTQAEYFYAGTAADLKKVYETLSSRLTVEKRETEVSALLALVGAALAVLAAGLSTTRLPWDRARFLPGGFRPRAAPTGLRVAHPETRGVNAAPACLRP
jgi:Ca-activated chloride channel family protein